VLARTAADVRAAHAAGRVALIPHVEGGEQLGGSLERLRALHALGVRSVGLTWNHTNDLADAALDSARWGGLSPLGEAAVREMNRLGVLVDLSHASDEAALDALALSAAPVVLSHSSARALADLPRNAPDEVLRRVAANGGVVMVTFVPYFTTDAYAAWYARGEAAWDSLRAVHGDDGAAGAMAAWEAAHPPPPVTLADVADHVEHVRRVAGAEHVGLGSDFDGMFSHVGGLEDVAAFPALLAELARRGWTDEELGAVAGGNVLRVLAEAERVAAEAVGR
jgi:membrane dipeptidase